MSDKILFNEQEESPEETDKVETNDSVFSRRNFMRNAVIGTAGVALLMNTPNRLQAASRLLIRQTNKHVEEFVDKVKNAKRSPKAMEEFQQNLNVILDAVENDSKSRATFDAIKSYISNPLIEVPSDPDAAASEVGMVIGAGYLRSVSALKETNKKLTTSEVKSRLANSKEIFDAFESDFFKQLHAKIKEESSSNSAFTKKLADANSELKEVASQLLKRDASGKIKSENARIVLASLTQQCPECTIVGVGCYSTETCLVIVGLVILLIIVLK